MSIALYCLQSLCTLHSGSSRLPQRACPRFIPETEAHSSAMTSAETHVGIGDHFRRLGVALFSAQTAFAKHCCCTVVARNALWAMWARTTSSCSLRSGTFTRTSYLSRPTAGFPGRGWPRRAAASTMGPDGRLKVAVKGEEILDNPMLNKGTAFTDHEREELGLRG